METTKRLKEGQCCLCRRRLTLTFHHLTPRCQHRKKWAKKALSKEDKARGINICRQCHSGIHRLYGVKELARTYSSLEALRADERIRRHVGWVAKQKVR
ncbi:MAG: hypothetical protein AAF725_13410 [Acidobacteriota bacterium]